MLALMHVSTWHVGISVVVLVLPPYLLAVYCLGKKHPIILGGVGLLMVALAVGGVIRDFENYQSFQRFARGQGYDLGQEMSPYVYISGEDVVKCLKADAVVFAISTVVTLIGWGTAWAISRNGKQMT